MTLPIDATLDTTFRCERFACTLALKHCVRRQTETRNGNAGKRDGTKATWSKPKHEFCASGTCSQGNEIRARFPDVAFEQVERRKPPRLDVVRAVEENAMKKPPENPTRDPGRAMTDRKCQCGCGRALRVNNTSGFSAYCNAEKYRGGARADRPSRAKAAPPLPPAPKTAKGRPARVVAPPEVDADALLRRRDDLLAEVAEVEGRLRVLLANEEAKVERMRKAVASLTKQAAEAA